MYSDWYFFWVLKSKRGYQWQLPPCVPQVPSSTVAGSARKNYSNSRVLVILPLINTAAKDTTTCLLGMGFVARWIVLTRPAFHKEATCSKKNLKWGSWTKGLFSVGMGDCAKNVVDVWLCFRFKIRTCGDFVFARAFAPVSVISGTWLILMEFLPLFMPCLYLDVFIPL